MSTRYIKLLVVKTYIYVILLLSKLLHVRIYGLGKIQSLLNFDCVISFKGKSIYYSHKIKKSYDLLIIGKSNEPETHLLFNNIVPKVEGAITFIDVGASVGEMIIGMSIYSNVEKIVGYEPRQECVAVIERSAELNNDYRIKVFNKALGDYCGRSIFYDNVSGTTGNIINQSKGTFKKKEITISTLDIEFPHSIENPIVLIDVEGNELNIITGGINFIKMNKPLIIFEYNDTSKKYFHLNDIKKVLRDDYNIYRLRGDGFLDKDMLTTWNCVAVPKNTQYEKICENLIKY